MAVPEERRGALVLYLGKREDAGERTWVKQLYDAMKERDSSLDDKGVYDILKNLVDSGAVRALDDPVLTEKGRTLYADYRRGPLRRAARWIGTTAISHPLFVGVFLLIFGFVLGLIFPRQP